MWPFGRSKVQKRLHRLERKMKELTDAIGAMNVAVAAMTNRISNHEAAANAAISQLNATIATLQASASATSPDVLAAIASIKSTTDALNNFDPDAPAPIPPAPAPVTPPAANP